MNIVAIT